MHEKMTSKERVSRAFAHKQCDRVPMNYYGNPAINDRLKQFFGLAVDDDDGLERKLGVDFKLCNPPYVGPRLHEESTQDVYVDPAWGTRFCTDNWNACGFPLKDATVEQVEAWPLPSPDDFDYHAALDMCKKHEDLYIITGGASRGDNINSASRLRTMEQVLIDLITDAPAGLLLMDRKNAINVEVIRRTLELCKGKVDMVKIGEDLGTQIGPMISPRLFRKHIRPRLQRIIDLAKEFGLPVMIHSCGSSSWAFDDFHEMGITVVDTLQPEARDMSPAYLKKKYGEKLSFHGMISTAGPLAYGSVDDVVDNVRETLKTMMPGGGYALAPSHQIQSNTPWQNVVAMYEAGRKHGTY